MKNNNSFPLAIACMAVLSAAAGAQTTYSHGDPTVYEQLLLELVNRARANPAAEAARYGIALNQGIPAGSISADPKPPLAFHSMLITAARGHTDWMLATDTFSHAGAGGSSPQQRMTAAGYLFTGSWTNGENISWGGTTGVLNMVQETHARHEGLFRSTTGHRQNICNPAFRDIGLGVQAGVFRYQGQDYNASMATEKFAASGSQPHSLVTGVVYSDLDGNGFYSVGEGLAGVTVFPEGGTWQTVTSTSGGYAVPYTGTTGNLTVSFSGGPLPRAERKQVARTATHVKLDLIPLPYVEIVPGSLSYSSGTGFSLVVRGTTGLTFKLQYSPTLTGWADVATRTMGATNITLTHNGGQPKGFYRLAW
jgi:uncharacterized protein YkwD